MNYKCITASCLGRRRRGSSHCSRCERVLEHVEREVLRESKDSRRLYIGRGYNLARRHAEHVEKKGLTRLTGLVRCDDPYRACSLESAAIKRLSYLAKLTNRTPKSLGGLRTDVDNYIYVASEPKRGRR